MINRLLSSHQKMIRDQKKKRSGQLLAPPPGPAPITPTTGGEILNTLVLCACVFVRLLTPPTPTMT